MEGVYLYCITHAGSSPPAGLTGIANTPVSALSASGLSGWVAPLERAPAAALDSIRRHHDVIAAAAAGGVPVVPVRFGQWLPSGDALQQRLTERAAEYDALLEEFRGAVEMGVRVVAGAQAADVPEPVAGHAAGREYMLALAREQARRREWSTRGEEIATELRVSAGPLVSRNRSDALSPPDLVSVAHLVRAADLEAYEAAVECVRQRHPELGFLVSGPWPPYSFAT